MRGAGIGLGVTELGVTLVLVLAAPPARAEWSYHPRGNLPVSRAVFSQREYVVVTDGAGGAFVAWSDFQSLIDYDIYAQHILGSGTVDPAWPPDGLAICAAAGDQVTPTIVTDGAGGAIIAWSDARGADDDIYAQRVLPVGVVDPAWPADGRALCTAAGDQLLPAIGSDGAGGAIVGWVDRRTDAGDIFAARVLASGVPDPGWPANGAPACTATGTQTGVLVVEDVIGGIFLAWQDTRSGVNQYDIYAQHIVSTGLRHGAWPVDGRAVCTATGFQLPTSIAADGSGGAIIAWVDDRNGPNDIYAQRVNSASSFAWTGDGVALCTAPGLQEGALAIADGSGGAIVTWSDQRDLLQTDVYALHVLATGAMDAAYPVNGLAIATSPGNDLAGACVPDGAGGAIIATMEARNGIDFDIYAYRLLASGQVEQTWVAGVPLCVLPEQQDFGALSSTGLSRSPAVSDGAGGAIVVWYDYRVNGQTSDLYAQRVDVTGVTGHPEVTSLTIEDVAADEGGRVMVRWDASVGDRAPVNGIVRYLLWRRLTTEPLAAGKPARLRLARTMSDPPPEPGEIRVSRLGSESVYWEYIASIPAEQLSAYAYMATTDADSMAGIVPWNVFVVDAEDSTAMFAGHYLSAPDSGYSVDDLAPAMPAPFTGEYLAGATSLHWGPSPESDVALYRLYRGSDPEFMPGTGNLVVAQSDTGYVDTIGQPFYYKLSAVDVHGNEGPHALLLPDGTAGVSNPSVSAVRFGTVFPQPARSQVSGSIALPHAARVSLAVHDVSGRRVRILVAGVLPAGEHAFAWGLRDANGSSVPSGLYFLRLRVDRLELARSVVVIR